jgi:sulfur-carrier protein adenylyltransferase/sulfurtransferase
MNNKQFNYTFAFSRNIGLITEREQELLRTKKVAIPGCGGVGGIHALTLARLGIGNFVIADFDEYALENMNRQWGAKMSTLGEKKVDVLAREIKEINPEANVEIYEQGIHENNIDAFLKGVNAVADSLDFFAFDARDLLFMRAHKMGIPVVTGGPLGFSCALLVFTGSSPSYRDFFNIKKSDSFRDKALKFAIGVAPAATQIKYMKGTKVDFESGKGPSSAVGVTQCASLVSGQILKILLGRGPVRQVPHFAQFDVYLNSYKKGYLPFGNKGPMQRLKIWYFNKFFLGKISNNKPDKPSENEASMQELGSNGMKREELQEIVRLMMRAPTGDNNQHWKFTYSENTLKIFHVEDRARHVFNQNNHASKIALGAILASAKIASSHFGFRVAEKIMLEESSNGEGSKHWAEFEFIKEDVEKDPMFAMLDQRASDRRLFKGGTTDHWVFDSVRELAKGSAKNNIYFCSDFKKSLLNYFAKCDTFVWTTEAARKDLYRWIRFSMKDARQTRDGIQWQSLGINPVDWIALKALRPAPIQAFMNKIGTLQIVKKKSRDAIKSSAALGLITVKDTSTEGLIDGGRLLIETWLRMNGAGYSFHILSSASLPVYDQLAGHGASEVSEEFKSIFKSGPSILKKDFETGPEELPLLAFRVGLTTPLPEKARTFRLDLDQILIVK